MIGSSSQASIGPILAAHVISRVIEWFDFLIYGMATACVFGKLFYPKPGPLTDTPQPLAIYPAGFFARAVGGALLGPLGDRIGRKAALMITMLVSTLGS
jgi:MHS family shikimate/dehydroshikimate transporter-like MFS transporter